MRDLSTRHPSRSLTKSIGAGTAHNRIVGRCEARYLGHRETSAAGVHVGQVGEPMRNPPVNCAAIRGPLIALLS